MSNTARPSEAEMHTAILGVWLELRMYVKAADFRARLQTHRKACIVRGWTTLALVWERHRDEAQQAWRHFARRPEIYGASTPEMVDRFKRLEREYATKAARWRAWIDWVWDHDLPASVEAYDPTCKQSELDADEPDRWAGVRLAGMAERWREQRRSLTRAHKSKRRSSKAL